MQGTRRQAAPPPRSRAAARLSAQSANRLNARSRIAIAAGLEARREEIESAAMNRVHAVAAPPAALGSAYAEGLAGAASAALRYLLEGVRDGAAGALRPPPAILTQARLAARSGVSLDTVLRRCFAGHALFGDFLMQEAERARIGEGAEMQRLHRIQGTLFDRLIAAVTEEYARESEPRPASIQERRAELVRQLLAGEQIDTAELAYDLEGFHLGLIASGEGSLSAIRKLAAELDRRLLAVRRGDVLWAWLGGREPLHPADLQDRATPIWPTKATLAIGESGEGLAGWRLSHRQAATVLPIAQRGEEQIVRYGGKALLATALQDDLLADSLRRIYLEPLEAERDRGETARETLHAYFAFDRNAASAAASLGISRQAVNSRLRSIEGTIARPLQTCATELELALRMERLSSPKHTQITTDVKPAEASLVALE